MRYVVHLAFSWSSIDVHKDSPVVTTRRDTDGRRSDSGRDLVDPTELYRPHWTRGVIS